MDRSYHIIEVFGPWHHHARFTKPTKKLLPHLPLLVLALILARPVFGALTLDCGGASCASGTGNGTSVASNALSTSNPGVVVAIIATNDAVTVDSIAGASLSFTQRALNANGNDKVWSFTAYSSAAISSQTFTANFSDSSSFATIHVFGISGTPTSSYFDTNGGLPVTGNSDPLSISTTATDTFIFAGFRMWSEASPTAGTGFTTIVGNGFLLTEYKIVSSSQSSLSVPIGTGSGNSNGGIADAIIQAPASSRRQIMPISDGS